MVDVSAKAVTDRSARARAIVRMQAGTAKALRDATLPKGDAMVAAQLAGIMAAKQTSNLIPLTHPLQLSQVEVTFAWRDDTHLQIDARVATSGQTGVEMEAMTAACVAALTIYDMTKALERGIAIESVQLIEKLGGKSGTWHAPE
jgi:cyclic pyranopterin phosphate synthase